MNHNSINDNYWVNRFLTDQTLNTYLDSNVKFHVVPSVPSAPGLPQRKGISPGVSDCQQEKSQLKSVKSVSCVTQLSCVNPVSNVANVVPNLPVGARLQNFWESWLKLGAGPKVVQILKEGYTLPFQTRPKLTRSPSVVSCYVNPQRYSYLLEALHQLIDKNAAEVVRNKNSLSFFNRLFLVPKPNNKWRPILDLSHLNLFLRPEKFKMETPETIRASLQEGEWVTSIDFKDAYFHIPIQEQSRKYLRFHVQEQTYHFIALIHPIQWTIAYPVGADRPAKRQKKTSCVSTGQAGPVLCTRQMACRTSFLSRQSDVIASFSFGACTCDTVFSEIIYFQVLCENYYVNCFYFCTNDF